MTRHSTILASQNTQDFSNLQRDLGRILNIFCAHNKYLFYFCHCLNWSQLKSAENLIDQVL